MHRPHLRALTLSLATLLSAGILAACIPTLGSPGNTSAIRLVSTEVIDGWRYEYFRNTAYPCSIGGYQTFTVATRDESSATATRPLWVYMHGGGSGYFDPEGTPTPNDAHMREESAEDQRGILRHAALTRLVADEPGGFRLLAVSMCNRDIYGGPDVADPNNPNTIPGGRPVTVNGLFATKAAIQHSTGAYPTDDFFLYGTSAGSFGTFHVAWGLEEQGLRAAGLVADSGVLNRPWIEATEGGLTTGGACERSEEANDIFSQRLHPDIASGENDPDLLVASERLTVPVHQVWSINDPGHCGTTPMPCPLRDGTTPAMGAGDCLHEPLRLAIAAQGDGSRSASMRLCVDKTKRPGTCDLHVPTVKGQPRNTLKGQPPDFNPKIVRWVQTRRGDD